MIQWFTDQWVLSCTDNHIAFIAISWGYLPAKELEMKLKWAAICCTVYGTPRRGILERSTVHTLKLSYIYGKVQYLLIELICM